MPRKTGGDDHRQSRVSSSLIFSILHHLRAQKTDVQLQQLVLSVGLLGRRYDGGLWVEHWDEGLEEVYECSSFDHDGQRESLDSAELNGPMIGRIGVSGYNANDQTSTVLFTGQAS